MNIHATGTALRRRDEILRLVRERAVRSQEELAGLLRARGFRVAQPTLSRDVRDLGLAKTATGYVLPASVGPGAEAGVPASGGQRVEKAVRDSVLSAVPAGSLVVLKTPPAQAHPVARALDEDPMPGVAGTIAGDDTIFVATTGAAAATSLAGRLRALLRPGARRPRGRRGA